MAAGDVICQLIRQRASSTKTTTKPWHERINWSQTARFSLIGATLHGPLFLRGFQWLDALPLGPPATLQSSIMRAAVGQCTIFPAYLSAFSIYMGVLEGRDLPGCMDKAKAFLLPTFLVGTAFWPLANVANFLLIPPTRRLLYVNAMGLIWNSYLSYSNSTNVVDSKSRLD